MFVFLWHISSVNATIVKAAVTPPSNSMFTTWWWKDTQTNDHLYEGKSMETAHQSSNTYKLVCISLASAFLFREDISKGGYDTNFWVLSYLIAADVVVTSIDAAAVWSSPQSFSHRLDIWVGVCTYDWHGPASVTLARQHTGNTYKMMIYC